MPYVTVGTENSAEIGVRHGRESLKAGRRAATGARRGFGRSSQALVSSLTR